MQFPEPAAFDSQLGTGEHVYHGRASARHGHAQQGSQRLRLVGPLQRMGGEMGGRADGWVNW